MNRVYPQNGPQVMGRAAMEAAMAPVQQAMATVLGLISDGDIFDGAEEVLIRQQASDLGPQTGAYQVSVPTQEYGSGGNGCRIEEGEILLYMPSTESKDGGGLIGFWERACCGARRSLTLTAHKGSSSTGPIVLTMHKPSVVRAFPLCCCCMRPHINVMDKNGDPIGLIDDPSGCCTMEKHVRDPGGNIVFKVEGCSCQLGRCCFGWYCADVSFNVTRNSTEVSKVQKLRLTFEESLPRFLIKFNDVTDPMERKLLLASAMLLNFQYFESA